MGIYKQLERLESLSEDWDNYGANKIPKKVIDNIKLFFNTNNRKYRFSLVPNPYGTVSLIRDIDTIIIHLEIGITKFSFYTNTSKTYTIKEEAVSVENFKRVGDLMRSILRKN